MNRRSSAIRRTREQDRPAVERARYVMPPHGLGRGPNVYASLPRMGSSTEHALRSDGKPRHQRCVRATFWAAAARSRRRATSRSPAAPRGCLGRRRAAHPEAGDGGRGLKVQGLSSRTAEKGMRTSPVRRPRLPRYRPRLLTPSRWPPPCPPLRVSSRTPRGATSPRRGGRG